MHTLCTKTHETEISVIKGTNYETNVNLKINIANTIKGQNYKAWGFNPRFYNQTPSGPELHTFKPYRQYISTRMIQ